MARKSEHSVLAMIHFRAFLAGSALAATSEANAGVRFVPGPSGTYAEAAAIANDGLSTARLYGAFTSAVSRFDDSGTHALLPPGNRPTYTSIELKGDNDSGVLVGLVRQASGFPLPNVACVWDVSASVAHELPLVNGATQYNTGADDGTRTVEINNQGVIAASAFRRSSTGALLGEVALRWDDANAGPVELQGLPLATGTALGRTYVWGINDAGTIIGCGMNDLSGSLARGSRVALRWLPGSTMPQRLEDLTTAPAGKRFTLAGSVNAVGVTVGVTDVYSGNTSLGSRAVLWDATTAVTELPSPTSSSSSLQYVSAGAINDDGTIGGSVSQGANRIALRWDGPQHVVSQLQTLGAKLDGSIDCPSVALNASGHIVGYSDFALNGANVRHATFWAAGGTAVVDLNTLLGTESANWILQSAYTITDTGWIGGGAWYDPDGAGPRSGGNRAYSILFPQAGTYGRGDADFDSEIDFDDLLILAQHYGESNPTQDIHVGDLNLDGNVNFDDLLALAQHFGSGAALDTSSLDSTFTADWALARSMVPEPASMVVGLGVLSVSRRKREV